MNIEDIKNKIRDDLVGQLGREPLDEEVDIEYDRIKKQENKDDIFELGLYRRFFNSKLKKILEKENLTYKNLYDKTKISQMILSRIINFKQRPTEKQRIDIAVALNTPIDELFPENYDDLYDKISPLPIKAETRIKILSLSDPEVLKLKESNEIFEESEQRTNFDASKIKEILCDFPPREQKILTMIFGLDGNGARTLAEVGQEFRVTGERIRSIEVRVLEKIKENELLTNHKKQGC